MGRVRSTSARRSGPGGQHRNKVETAVSLRHLSTGVGAEANERRSQAQNRAAALFRLRANLALEVRRPCASDYLPSLLWQSRCGRGLKVSAAQEDFPRCWPRHWTCWRPLKPTRNALPQRLNCTPSQLVRLLKLDPRAFLLVNRWRNERKLHRLR